MYASMNEPIRSPSSEWTREEVSALETYPLSPPERMKREGYRGEGEGKGKVSGKL